MNPAFARGPIFALARCDTCRTQHAFYAKPMEGFQIFDMTKPSDTPTHICRGFPMCLRGHALEILHPHAAQVANGRWLVLNEKHDGVAHAPTN